jgi:hypothetical protein
VHSSPNLVRLNLVFKSLESLFSVHTVISFSVEIRIKTVEYTQFNFRHRFWPNFFQFGRNSTLDWFYMRRFGLNSASLEKFRPILALVPPKSVAEILLRAFNRFYTNFDHFGRKQNYCVWWAVVPTLITL